MTERELIDKCNELNADSEYIKELFSGLENQIKRFSQSLEELPDELSDLEDDKE